MKMNTRVSLLAIAVSSITSLSAIAADRIDLDAPALFSQHTVVQEIINTQSFAEGASALDVDGNLKVRINQTYQGIPVYGESFVATQNSLGTYTAFSGSAVSGIAQDIASTVPDVSQDEALSTFASHWDHDNSNREHTEASLVVWLDDNDTAHLAWQLSYVVYGDEPTRPVGFVDAHSGEILDTWDGLNHAQGTGPGGNSRTGRYHFGTDYPAFDVKQNGSTCSLDSTNVETLDMKHQKSGGSIHTFTCFENTERQVNGAYSALNDAHKFGQVVFDMYKDWYGIAPIRQKLRMRVHYDRNYENAFWDGQQMTFGDGQSYFYPLVSLDVVSHEVSHGVTQQNSNLEYKNQSGGMNESFSDMAGGAAIYYLEGSYNFKIGDRIKKGSGAMRHMDNPPLDGKSIGHARDYYSGIDVHHSSGVYNKAFYLLSSKQGWNIRKAFDVFVKANQLYWTARSTFDQGGVGSVKAAKDLGYCVDDVVDAFSQVGVNAGSKTGQGCGSVEPGVDAKFDVTTNELTAKFTSKSTGPVVSYAWNFGDGSSSNQQNPSHTYSAPGSYTVTLTVADKNGKSDMATETVTVQQCMMAAVSYPAWDASTSYKVGDKVSYNGKAYEAIWWSTGAQPNIFTNVWKVIGDSDGPDPDPCGSAPVANFSVNVSDKTAVFTNSSTDDGSIVSYSWNFGDGSGSTSANPSHTYAAYGTYSVVLTVTDNEGNTGTKTASVVVKDPGNGPVCAAPWDAGKVYLGGDQVSHNGQKYEAKWWTQGEDPSTTGQWGVWKPLGACQ